MRIAVAGFMHESNTFTPLPTNRASFAAQSLSFGPALLSEWRDAHHEVGAFFEAATTLGFEPVPLLMAWATPSGPVTADIYDEITGKIIEGLRREKPDGLLLALHGAMVSERYRDADGETVRRIRAAMGPDFPIVVTLDLHGNMSRQFVENCNAAVSYRTNPHVDQRDCGKRAAALLVRHLRGEIRLKQALAKPDTLINIMVQDTSQEPLKRFIDQARDMEKKPNVLTVSLLPGFPYADVPQMGPSIIVVTNNDAALAQQEADTLAAKIWQAREELSRPLPDAATAVKQALQIERRPVLLIDTGDNVGGGSSADSTILLAELLKQQATEAVVCLFAPEEVQVCARAGIGAQVNLKVGGKVDRHHGDPVTVQGTVRVLHDGTYIEPAVRHGGKRLNHMGLTALVEIERNNLLVLTTLRHPPFSLGQLTCLGVRPELQRIVVVKAAIAYKAAYAPLHGTIIEVDTPGRTAVNPRRFTYEHARRPLYPLDA